VKYSIEFLRKCSKFKALALHQNFTSGFTPASLRVQVWMGLARTAGDPRPEEREMKTNRKPWALTLCAFALTLATTSGAVAACGRLNPPVKHPSGLQLQYGHAQLLTAALLKSVEENENGAPIVGMWHVVFTEDTVNGTPVTPSGFDNSVVVWHSDGTEIMNSSRPAQDGNFCLGVWSQTGPRQYLVNHIPWQGNDPFGNPQDGAQILEAVTLSPDGNHYSGKFTFTGYDINGHATVTITGQLTATRITVTTPFSSLL
jgi:hypothetical protein